MLRLIYKNKFYIYGKPHEVIEHLKKLSEKYLKVKELLDCYTKDL